MEKILQDLKRLCKLHKAELIEKPHGHFQIKGALLVNYYPYSKKSTAYVAGTQAGKRRATPKEAVKMAFNPPEGMRKAKRRSDNARARRRLWKKGVRHCYWCKRQLTLKPDLPESATLEHIIPLARGGLNNMNNYTLACGKCNRERGHDMPELANG